MRTKDGQTLFIERMVLNAGLMLEDVDIGRTAEPQRIGDGVYLYTHRVEAIGKEVVVLFRGVNEDDVSEVSARYRTLDGDAELFGGSAVTSEIKRQFAVILRTPLERMLLGQIHAARMRIKEIARCPTCKACRESAAEILEHELAETDAMSTGPMDPTALAEHVARAREECEHGGLRRKCDVCALTTDLGLAEIALEQKKALLASCEAALAERDEAITRAREEGRRAGLAEAAAFCDAYGDEHDGDDCGGGDIGREHTGDRHRGAYACAEAIRALVGSGS